MKKILVIILLVLVTMASPFGVLTIAYNTQTLYAGVHQTVYEFLLSILGFIVVIAGVFAIVFIDDFIKS